MWNRRIRLLTPLLPLLALAAAPETFTRDELDRLMAEKAAAEARLQALESARTLTDTDVRDLDSRLIAAAMESRRREEQASIAERRLIDLDLRRASLRQSLVDQNADLEALLAALALASAQQPPALVVAPGAASDAIRAAVVMGETAPLLKERSQALAREMRALEKVERDLRREQARLEAAEAVLAEKRVEIERLAAAKRSAFEDLSAEAEALRAQVRELAGRATTLESLLSGLERLAPPTPGTKPQAPRQLASLGPAPGADRRSDAVLSARPLEDGALGGMAKPATGLLVRRFGDTLPGGSRSDGLTISTRSEAQIVAPVDGRIAYADEFRSYGQMLILTTSDGYHVILSGMSTIYGSKDQWVTAGEPVGRMAARAEPPPELYLEVRKDGKALDPSQWMKGKL